MKKLLANPILVLALRLVVGGLFVYAAIDKIAHPHKFAIAIDNYHFLPEILVNLWAIGLPWLELFIGLLLIAGVFVQASALVSALLYLSFFIALSAALARGLDISCGCFEMDDAKARINSLYLVRDFSLFVGSLWIVFGYRGKLALESILRKD